MKKLTLIISGFFALMSLAFNPPSKIKTQYGFNQIQNLDELENLEAFSFSIISDNHGASPLDNIQMAKMAKWVENSNDAFVLGVGDHLQKNKDNDFLTYLIRNDWWRANFYPNTADAENDYFGSGEGDLKSGSKIYKFIGLEKRPNVEFNPNNSAEYHAKMYQAGVIVHYIVLHFPDHPYDQNIAFSEDSKNYLIKTLNSIQKAENEIIIVSAHSMYGSWIDNLNPAQQKIVNSKCDLLLAGTTHYFERRVLEGQENSGPLMINAGSVNKARWGCNNGFVQVHVVKNPLALVVQYVNTDDSENKLQGAPYSFVKYINSNVYPLAFPNLTNLEMVAHAN